MGVEYYTRGKGITKEARFRVFNDAADLIAVERPIKEFFRQWRRARAEGGGDYGAIVLEVRKFYRELLTAAEDGPFERDSEADFANRIIEKDELIIATISRGDADAAARHAVEMGCLIRAAEDKFLYEPKIIEFEQTKEIRTEGARSGGKARSDVYKAEKAKVYKAFETSVAKSPHFRQLPAPKIAKKLIEAHNWPANLFPDSQSGKPREKSIEEIQIDRITNYIREFKKTEKICVT